MKNLKKILALLVAVLMIAVSMSAAFAEDPAYNAPVTVSGLDNGDVVHFYKIVEWVGEQEGNISGWKVRTPYASVLNENAFRTAFIGTPAVADDPATTDVDETAAAVPPTGITTELAGKLAQAAASDTQIGSNVTAASNKASLDTATVTGAGAGMYMALITPTDADTIYNPVFVSSNWKNGEATQAASTYEKEGVAKKSTVTLQKEASTSEDNWDDKDWKTAAIGDTITYTVKTTIPAFGSVYEAPFFDVKDQLTGLALDKNSVTLTKPTGLVKDTDYTITEGTDNYTVSFKADYLKKVTTATEVEITYTAKVTKNSTLSVDWTKNEVSIEFSHDPSNQSDKKVKKDTTQHYQFSIDGNGFGGIEDQEGKRHTEIVKIGQNADGTPINKETEVVSDITTSNSQKSPLAGAEFKLYTDEACETEYIPKKADGSAGTALNIVSDQNGRMLINGLDAGTYYLKEEKAPDGFVKDTQAHKIEIKAFYKDNGATEITEYWDGTKWLTAAQYDALDADGKAACQECKYTTNILDYYTVTIDGKATSTFKFTNDGKSTDIKWTDEGSVELPSPIINTKGVELPSTGGIGTTLFYIGGSILVLAAVILLVTKRRMSAED